MENGGGKKKKEIKLKRWNRSNRVRGLSSLLISYFNQFPFPRSWASVGLSSLYSRLSHQKKTHLECYKQFKNWRVDRIRKSTRWPETCVIIAGAQKEDKERRGRNEKALHRKEFKVASWLLESEATSWCCLVELLIFLWTVHECALVCAFFLFLYFTFFLTFCIQRRL